jgi:hypothetical protein
VFTIRFSVAEAAFKKQFSDGLLENKIAMVTMVTDDNLLLIKSPLSLTAAAIIFLTELLPNV